MKSMIMALAAIVTATAMARETAIYQGKLVGDMNAGGNTITNLANPVNSGDAVNKAYVDAAGGMTPQNVGTIATNTVNAKVAPWAMSGQPQPTTDLTPAYNHTDNATNALATSMPLNRVMTNGVIDLAALVATNKVLGFVWITNATPAGITLNSQPGFDEGLHRWLWYGVDGEGEWVHFRAWQKTDTKTETYTFEFQGSGSGTTYPDFTAVHKLVVPVMDFINEDDVKRIVTNRILIGFTDWNYTQNYSNARWTEYGWYIDVEEWGSVACDDPERLDQNATTLKMSGSVCAWRSAIIGNNLGLVATNDLASAIRDATNNLALASTVNQWENYWRGDRVRLSVTNYYGNSSGEPPRLRIEESQTNAMGVVTNWVQVWDEVTRQTNYYNRVNADLAAISNNVMTASFIQTYNQLATKAPRAWGELTSSGEDAPPNTVWHTAPRSVFAGGTEYAHVAVGEGSICVLVDKGAPVYTAGAEGQFRFTDDSGANFFGFDVRSSYTLGCRTDGIAVSNGIVILSYDLTSASPPEILQCTNLTDGVWNTAQATWEQNPPAGMQICYMPTNGVCGFYKAQLSYAGGAKFLTNMQADLQGGIAASNETSDVIQSVYPVIVNGTVQWRLKQ